MEKVEKLIGIDFESRPTYGFGDKCIKTKVRIYIKNIFTSFHDKKYQKKKYHVNVYQ